MIKKFLTYLYQITSRLNEENIISLLEKDINAKIIDLGCDDGENTLKFARSIGTRNMFGIEIVRRRAESARRKNINVKISNLDKKWLYKENYFDVIIANQVIEHVSDVDHFAKEIKRVLKDSGYAIISTENASSWHNIIASIMGWQMFSMTPVSNYGYGIGNPFALHRKEKSPYNWTHKTVFNYLGLKEFFEVHGFKCGAILGSGYHPFPPQIGQIDVRHAHFITIKIKKALFGYPANNL